MTQALDSAFLALQNFVYRAGPLAPIGEKITKFFSELGTDIVNICTGLLVFLLIAQFAYGFFNASNPQAIDRCKRAVVWYVIFYILLANAQVIADFIGTFRG